MDQTQAGFRKGKEAFWHKGIGVILALFLLSASLINLESFPPVWWDEGWTLTVARNWVERGYYGRFLAGEPSPPGLEAAFPTTALVALSFKIFGIGIWQGRLIGVLCTIGALGMMYYLSLRLYSPTVAIGSLLIILFMSPHLLLHPLFMGRQVLAENPMLFFLLAGYAFFVLALQRSLWFLGEAVLLWGISLNSKAQVAPFWVLSLGIPLVVAWFYGRRNIAFVWGLALAGSFIISRLLSLGQELILQGHTIPTEPLQGIYEVTALVFERATRFSALQFSFGFGFPILISFYFSAKTILPEIKEGPLGSNLPLVRLSLLIFSGSWFFWYMLLSAGYGRYLYPPVFIGGLFLAVLLYELTGHYQPGILWDRLADAVRRRRLTQKAAEGLLALLLIAWSLTLTLKALYKENPLTTDTSALKTAEIFNMQTPGDTLIETYESEIHFLLNRPVHYPPDHVHVELNRRTFLGQTACIGYNPLAANPDYLIIGVSGRIWGLYDSVIVSGAFRPISRIGRYDVYKRMR